MFAKQKDQVQQQEAIHHYLRLDDAKKELQHAFKSVNAWMAQSPEHRDTYNLVAETMEETKRAGIYGIHHGLLRVPTLADIKSQNRKRRNFRRFVIAIISIVITLAIYVLHTQNSI
jgi:ferric-dicitrate binding protein FerR (iron transport regulator)